jgi:thiamine-phosphate pyrophosphorylase
MSKELLSQICSSVTIPVVAIGGINKDNIDYLEDTNISGVAVIDGIFGEDDITATTEVLYNKIHAITGGM